jgi:mannose-6-phosphate isomerase-like protein (cupin superfamily)
MAALLQPGRIDHQTPGNVRDPDLLCRRPAGNSGMSAPILRPHPGAEVLTEERCHILELSNDDSDPAMSIARARVGPGVTTRWHRVRDTVERYVILDGVGRMEVGDYPPQEVQAGDVVMIPPSVRQRIANAGEGDLVFLAICTPRFCPEAYEDAEST